MNKTVNIFGGGTIEHIANHFALCAPAYGTVARQLEKLCHDKFYGLDIKLHLTKMAGGNLESTEDIQNKLHELIADPLTKVIFFSCAICDYRPEELTAGPKSQPTQYKLGNFGKNYRLDSSYYEKVSIEVSPQEKLIKTIRQKRKDIFLIGFKTTCNVSEQSMFEAGLRQCKNSSVNLVLVNDTKTRMNMIVTPEEATYCVTNDREKVLKELVDIAWHRSHLTFTQSTVLEGHPVHWNDSLISPSVRTIVEYCINSGAYKEFNGSTVGHFAIKLSDTEFLTSIRKSNFNHIAETGMVYVKTDGPDTVLAYGAKPSVGGQSQRIVFRDHPGYDAIVHFHCEMKKDHKDEIPVRSQREVECGSMACGERTSQGLKQFGNLKAVMLDNHGPNIVFSKDVDPQEVIDFINANFDLNTKTGGYTV